MVLEKRIPISTGLWTWASVSGVAIEGFLRETASSGQVIASASSTRNLTLIATDEPTPRKAATASATERSR